MLKEYIINEFGINPKVADICFDAEKKVEKYFKKIDEITEYNQCKVIKAMQKNRLSEAHLNGTTGYGYKDMTHFYLLKVHGAYPAIHNVHLL